MTEVGGIDGKELLRLIERIERLEKEKLGIAADIRSVYEEGKSTGFDTKIKRKVIRLRAMELHQIEEEEVTVELYKRALGMKS
ncbi:MAG: DUF2312 domain-containing protein [Magnetococcales bacterium]|nr:DUF2312 domain-containing protein [Magnetococcales bacterium]